MIKPYKPNTRGQFMSYLDKGAPDLVLGSRASLFAFLDTVLTIGYNKLPVTSIVKSTVEGNQVLTVTYSTDHGYQLGQLITIEGATEALFNTQWRVSSKPTPQTLTLEILDQSVVYPNNSTGTVTSIVSPLDWEIAYTSSTQRSYRSKLEYSSKNVLTIIPPRHKKVTSTYTLMHEVQVSKNIGTDGSLIDSYTSGSDYLSTAANDNNPFGAFYLTQHLGSNGYSFNSPITANNTARVPWYFIGDGRIFYFIRSLGYIRNPSEISNLHSYVRGSDNASYRDCFVFGDPDALDERDVLSGNATVLGTEMLDVSLVSKSDAIKPFTRYSVPSISLYSMRDFKNIKNIEKIDLISIFGGFSFISNTTNLLQTYPNMITGGWVYYPVFGTSVSRSEGGIRAEFPYAVASFQGLNTTFPAIGTDTTAYSFVDYNLFKDESKNMYSFNILNITNNSVDYGWSFIVGDK